MLDNVLRYLVRYYYVVVVVFGMRGGGRTPPPSILNTSATLQSPPFVDRPPPQRASFHYTHTMDHAKKTHTSLTPFPTHSTKLRAPKNRHFSRRYR